MGISFSCMDFFLVGVLGGEIRKPKLEVEVVKINFVQDCCNSVYMDNQFEYSTQLI